MEVTHPPIAFTADDARDYVLLAAQSPLGIQAIIQAIANVQPRHAILARAIAELSDRDAKRLAGAIYAWLQTQHPALFKA